MDGTVLRGVIRFDRFDSTDKLLGNGRDGGTEREARYPLEI